MFDECQSKFSETINTFYFAVNNNTVTFEICRNLIIETLIYISKILDKRKTLDNLHHYVNTGPNRCHLITVDGEISGTIGGCIDYLSDALKVLSKTNNNAVNGCDIDIIKINLTKLFESYGNEEFDIFNKKCKEFLKKLK